MKPLVSLMAPGQVSGSLDEFRRHLREEEPKFRPLGEKVGEWNREKDGEGTSPDSSLLLLLQSLLMLFKFMMISDNITFVTVVDYTYSTLWVAVPALFMNDVAVFC